MSDTVFFNRVRVTGAMKAVLVYVLIDVVLSGLSSLGQFLYALKESDWTALWGPQKFGLILIQLSTILGSALLMFKGALSKSTKADQPPNPQPPPNA